MAQHSAQLEMGVHSRIEVFFITPKYFLGFCLNFVPCTKFTLFSILKSSSHGIIGVHCPPPKILGPPFTPKLQVPP